ncbi:MAG: Gfo/Idh/MocA family oxidoreductase [Actinomycetes bacterium]
MLSVAWLVDLSDPELNSELTALRARMASAGFCDAGHPADAAALRLADVVVVWVDRPLPRDLVTALADPAVSVVLAGPTLTRADPDRQLADAAGLLLAGSTPVHDVRVRPGPDLVRSSWPTGHQHRDGDHVDEHEHIGDRVAVVDKASDDVQILLTARVGLVEQPVLTWRPATSTAAWTLGSVPGAVGERAATRAMVVLLRLVTGRPEAPPVGVGLLGFGAIGHEHSRAVRAVSGLSLAAVCDTSQARLDAASAGAPGVLTTTSADELLERDDVDLVVVSTPPSTHARWALRVLAAGKHVIVEKPFAIRTAEADEVLAEAQSSGLLAAVYQNRRYDPDHLAVRRLVESGAIGDIFQIETFIGGYGHPCNLWHSDEEVSGGAFYDWGSHVLDQILDLIPHEVEYVTAAAHKRRWFDVTNADHSRVTVRFVDGVEAEFVHSDLAAALKPRWYVLGTQGAIVGHWRTEKVVARNDIGTLSEDVLAPADSPPLLELYAADGSITRVATPVPEPYGFHQEVADRVRLGLPMTVTGDQSRRVLAVMEAARSSAADDGRPVAPL